MMDSVIGLQNSLWQKALGREGELSFPLRKLQHRTWIGVITDFK